MDLLKNSFRVIVMVLSFKIDRRRVALNIFGSLFIEVGNKAFHQQS